VRPTPRFSDHLRTCINSCFLLLGWTSVALSLPAPAQTLHAAVEQAIQTNPEVLASASQRLATDEQLKQAQAGYWPRLDLDAGYGRERLDTADTRVLGMSETTLTRHNAAATLSQMLFDGFAVKSEVARQRARVDSSANSVAATAEDIALRTVGAYLEVLRRLETVAFAADSLDAHQRIYELVKLRADSGVGRRADLDQVEARLALARANLRAEQSGLQDAEVTFLRVVGTAPHGLVKPVSMMTMLPLTKKAALDTALANHPALKSAQADLSAATAQHEEAKAALSPRLDLELSAIHDRDLIIGRDQELTAMLRVRYNLSRGGADLARVNETRHLIQQASEIVSRTQREVAESVSLAFNAYLTARERIGMLKQYADSSEATRAAYAEQYRIGQRTLLDLLNAENEYFTARSSYATGQYTALATIYRVFAGMGQLLSALQIGSPAAASTETASSRN
jgi:adhesin transport system outer membrane protein